MKYTIEIQADDEFVELIDAENLVTAAETTLQTTEEPTAALTLVITSDEVVQQLNRDYRGIDAPTDVLSFANQDLADDAPTQLAVPDELASEVAAYLGDVIIAYPYAKRQAEHFQNTIAAELRLLVVHGTLHLLGYDHATPAEREAMWAIQNAVLTHFGDQNLSARAYADDPEPIDQMINEREIDRS